MLDLLIAIGIVGLLLSLLLPAVQAAREASRRTQCTSNMRQIGIALQEHHGIHRMFPPTVVWSPAGEPLGRGLAPPGTIDRVSAGVASGESPDRMFESWVVPLLPFLEEQGLFDAYDRKACVDAPQNELVRSTSIDVLKCPSDPANGHANPFQRKGITHVDRGYARANYAMNAGPNERCLARLGPHDRLNTCPDGFQVNGTDLRTNTSQVWGSGIGGVNRGFSLKNVVSGSSKMVAVEEVRAGANLLDRRGVWALGFPGCSVTAAHGTKGNGGPNAKLDCIQGCSAAVAMGVDQSFYEMPCRLRSDPSMEVCEQATSRSCHVEGVNVIMADGSAHFVGNSVDSRLWEQMHKRNNTLPLEFEFE